MYGCAGEAAQAKVPVSRRVDLARLDELVLGVLAQSLELAVAGAERSVGSDDHRSGDEPVEDVERVVLVDVAHRRDRVDERAAREDRHPVEQGALLALEQ